jgi:hypothetical protein
MTDPAVWRDLRSAFQQLAFKYGDRLKPSWKSIPWEHSGDHWHVVRQTTHDARERDLFISLAKRAGVHLAGRSRVDPLFAWLDHLRKTAHFTGGHATGDVGEFEFGTIEHPCEASANCCLDLETDTMARSHEEVLTSGNGGPRSRTEEDRAIHQAATPEVEAPSSGWAADASSLSSRDLKIHAIVGEHNFRTLTNAELMKTHGVGRRLREECELRTEDAVKSCLDRIRKARGYPLSRDITKKRSAQL